MIISLANIIFKSLPKESIIEFLAVAIALGTLAILWKHRKSPEVKYLIFIELSAAIWALTAGFEFMSSTLETKQLWSQASYLGFSFMPLLYFLFASAFSQKIKYITPTSITLLLVIPFITISLSFTNDFHHLIWSNVTLDAAKNMLVIEHGMWFWIFWAYSFTLVAAGFFNLLRSIYEFTAYYRSQINILLIATLIPLAGNMMYITGISPIPEFDWTPVSFSFTGLVITFGIIKFRMFDLVPFARNKLIDTMSDGVIVINAEGFIEDHNPAVNHIFNLKSKSIIRKRFEVTFSQYENLVEGVTGDSTNLVEIETTNNGKQSFYQVRISPIYDRNQKLSGHLLQINDITSLKETENKLKEEIEERGRLIEDLDAFAHTVAHDLRNSLGSVHSSSEIIIESLNEGNTEVSEEFATMIKIASNKAIQITQELLILATVSHDEIERKPLDMLRIFSGAKSQIEELILQSKTQIVFPAEWPVALGYSTWIEEVWVNYITNAIKYGGAPPKLEAGSNAPVDGMIRFWVQDNGDGISAEDQSKLFLKYSRLVPEKADGYGLGLSIVKRIIEKLGGQVGVDSTGKEGEGAKFWFELPSA
ncbi:PAS/PAC sensor signal transduction histidine kinase [Mariniphaga anaerophila]|uniref:histidine kinase n=1 Tax=Mariniphaga anaerophila TaxID=1484053 RepID=A0A1M5EZ96_9BACT|nr:histidine kinase N-terminal 7TM domain-containing protein [Mariniphaga anaerophila]SHF84508.1 PAS/PAC sensor signal transduction histidine kinase [Mariniphaga anaerophila]